MAQMSPSPRRPVWTDAALACASGVTVFSVYLATVYPGLVPIGDAAKFSFVGRVLGTPHAPGYPLWVILSHLFSYVPWGTLAYRMNVFSALLGAGAVAATYALARRLGVERPAAVAVALALGFGQAFWATSLYPKAYTLNALLAALGVGLLLRWSDDRRESTFLLAVAVFAASAGNHLTVVALVPALVLFAMLTDARTVLRPRLLAVAGAIVLAGLAQYLLILVRTLQGAPFLEARARNLGELWQVMTARRWAHEIGAHSPGEVVTERLPLLFDVVWTELGALGLPLVAVGVAALITRQPRRAALICLGALGVVLLTASMGSEEDRGFLLPAFVLLWVIAGAGIQWLVDLGRRHGRVVARVAVVVFVVALPVGQLAANYVVNDHHAETFETEYFDALFADLPERTAIVRDDYHHNMMVTYKLLGEDAARGREVRLVHASDRESVEALRARGYEVLAFRSSRDRLSEFGFAFSPYVPPDPDRARVLARREIFRVEAVPICREVGNLGWTDISEVARPKGRLSIRIDNYRPFDASATFYAASERPLAPALVGSRGSGTPSLVVESFAHADAEAMHRLLGRSAQDGVTLPKAAGHASYVTRAEVRVNDRGEHAVFGLDFGANVTWLQVSARVDQDTPHRASVCTHPLAGTAGWDSDSYPLRVAPDSHNVQFDSGWHAIERAADGQMWRWTSSRAVLIVPVDTPGDAVILIHGEPFGGHAESTALALEVNGHRLETRDPPSPAVYPFAVPASVLRTGLNEIAIEVSGAARPADSGAKDTRLLGLQVTSIELVPH